MKRNSPPVFFVAVMVVGLLVGGAILFSQRQETIRLQGERDLASMQQDDLARLQTENLKLRQRQIPAGELEALRADHAALVRLRGELEKLQKK